MEVSRRAQSIKASSTLAISAKAAELKAQGKDMVTFGVGEPDFDTPAPIREAAKKPLMKAKQDIHLRQVRPHCGKLFATS